MARGRMTIGLYNSYDPARFAEAHRRAIARAAPIALAFDANLATFGFPFEKDLRTPVDIAAWISGTRTWRRSMSTGVRRSFSNGKPNVARFASKARAIGAARAMARRWASPKRAGSYEL